MDNGFIPFPAKILDVIKHTALEWTFRLEFAGNVRPGQFFEVSIPRFGEAPISVSGTGSMAGINFIDLTIRRVGLVTNEVFGNYKGKTLLLRGPYGNGFDVALYQNKELVIVAGGTGVSPVRGVIEHFTRHYDETKGLTLIAGFKTPQDILFKDDFKVWRQSGNVILTVDNNESDTSYKTGLVTEYIPHLELQDVRMANAIVVGPPPMMRFSVKALLERGFIESNIWVSQERRMCCGLGKCGHCRINDVYVCLDGPVFNYSRAKFLID